MLLSFLRLFFSRAQTTIGGGLAYGSEIDELGLGLDAEFYLKNNLSISPDLIFYFVDGDRFVDRGFWEINVNANYYFVQQNPVSVYGLAGLSLSNIKIKYDDGFNEYKRTDSELGLNLGIGTNFDVGGSIQPFAEFNLP